MEVIELSIIKWRNKNGGYSKFVETKDNVEFIPNNNNFGGIYGQSCERKEGLQYEK